MKSFKRNLILGMIVLCLCLSSKNSFAYTVDWNLINDDFNDLSLWDDVSIGIGGYSEIDPAGQLHLDSTVVADANAGIIRHWVAGGIPDDYVIETKTFLSSIGTGTGNSHTIQVGNGTFRLWAQLRLDGLFVLDKNDVYNEVGTDVVQVGQWQEWRFVVSTDNSNIGHSDIYLNGNLLQGNVQSGVLESPTFDGLTYLEQSSYNVHTESHTEYFRMGTLSTPVPEPGTIVLFGIGLAGLAGVEVRRRRKKAKQ